jgi:hypothetical protein
MLLLIALYVIQALLIIHVIKTGRNQLWIWVLLLLPAGIGALAYQGVEIIPELLRSRTAQRTARSFRKAIDPGAQLRRYESEARVAGHVAGRQRYAEELVRHARYDEAIASTARPSPGSTSTIRTSCWVSRRPSSPRAMRAPRAPRSMSSSG